MTRRARWFLILGVALALGIGFSSCSGGGGGKKKKAAILNVSPTSGPEAGGTPVVIDTKNFKDDFTANLPIVTFGTSPAASVVAVDLDSVTATTPVGPVGGGIVDVQVVATVSGRSARLASAFTYAAASQCTVSSVIPNQGTDAGGTTVIITGTNFENDLGTIVTFDGVQATGFGYISPTQIQCVTPAGSAGLVDVQVVSASRNCMLANAYTYIASGPTCSISLPLVPSNGNLSGGTTVQISGTDFDATTTVTFGGVPATSVTFMSANLITAVTPADPLGIPGGNYDVMVCVNTGAGAQCCQPNAFHYNLVPVNCSIASVNPTSGVIGGGTPVTITGAAFAIPYGNNTVTFGATPATVTSGSDTFLNVTAPAGTGTVAVSVDTGTSTCTLPAAFTYVQCQGQQCQITNVTPGTGRVGDWITITGGNFSAGASVSFDTTPALAVDDSGAAGGTLLAQVPPSPGPLTVDINVINTTGRCCTENNAFTYIGCTVGSVSPSSGPSTGGQPVTITGSFGAGPGTISVLFGAQAATVGFDDATTIIATTPPGNGCVNVTVTDRAGDTCYLPAGYCYSGCTVTSMTPSSGGTNGGGGATIIGSGFNAGTMQIRFTGFPPPYQYGEVLVDPMTIVVTGSTQLDFPIPPGPSGVNVTVEVKNLLDQSTCFVPGGYTYIAPGGGSCSIASLNPVDGSMGGGTNVTITGSGFGTPGSTAGVLFRTLAATNVVVVSSTQITCTTPPYAGPMGGELVDVQVCPASSDPCRMANAYTYTQGTCPGGCTLTGCSPGSGPAAGGNTVTISGSGLCGDGLAIMFGGTPSSNVTWIDEFTIQAVVPAGAAGTVDIIYVDGSGCFTSCTGCYTYN